MDYVIYPCGCSASKGSPTYCPTHMAAMPLIREYAQFMYDAGYDNERQNGDYSTEAADFERRIAVLAAQQAAPAAQPEQEPIGEVEIIESDEHGEKSAWVALYNDVELGAKLYAAPVAQKEQK